MRKLIIVTLLLVIIAPASFAQKIVFYLHGAIVEGNCDHPTNSAFGEYKYHDIVSALRSEKFTVLSDCRPANTDVKDYAHKVAKQVDSLLKKGVKPGDITVIGASKGAMIAMYVSSILKNKNVNFVFMSNCNDNNLASGTDINFCGNILSIYEKSDGVAGTCEKYKLRSKLPITHYKEIELNTGLKHGYIYRPIPEWMKPAMKWANGHYE